MNQSVCDRMNRVLSETPAELAFFRVACMSSSKECSGANAITSPVTIAWISGVTFCH